MEPSKLDCSNIARRVWLVKVPKYVSTCWSKAMPDEELGKIIIGNDANGKASVMFSLSETLANTAQSTKENDLIPSGHQFKLSDVKHQTLAVFSENDEKMLTVEGLVGQKVECRPIETDEYMAHKMKAIENAEIPFRVTKRLNKAVVSYKPIKPITATELDGHVTKKSAKSTKRYRIDKETVKDMIFEAFGSRKFYPYKQLADLIQQPDKYLREILKELCDYDVNRNSRRMYSLKKEYSHYNKDSRL